MSLQLSDNLKIKLKEIAHRLKMTPSIPAETTPWEQLWWQSSVPFHCTCRLSGCRKDSVSPPATEQENNPCPSIWQYNVQWCTTISAFNGKETKTSQNKQPPTPTVKQLYPTWQHLEHRSFLASQDINMLQTGGKVQFSHQHRSVKSGLSSFLNIL